MTPTIFDPGHLRPVPATWCYRCGYDHTGPDVCGSSWTEPRTAASVAWSAVCRAIESLIGRGPWYEASPEVLDLIAMHLTDRAGINRARQGDRPQQAADR